MAMERKRTYSSLNDLKSHPDKLLTDHLSNVGILSKKFMQEKNLNIDDFVDFNTIQDIAYLIGITHDFGKATAYFQEYINDPIINKRLKNKDETHHAFISSIFTYYVVKRYLNEKCLLKVEYYEYLPLICFLVVKKHHGNLDNADDELYSISDDSKDIIKRQIDSMTFDEISTIYKKFFSDYIGCTIDVFDFKERYGPTITEIINDKRLVRQLKDKNSLLFYFLSLLFYSILLDADKTDAANLDLIKRRVIPCNIVDEYEKRRFFDTMDNRDETDDTKNKGINKMRKMIYDEVVSKTKDLNLDKDKILSLNVPTGTGKTLTSFSFAIKLRERIKEERGFCPRIIYSLPFLSIIDQNSKEFAKVLAPLCGVSWDSLFDLCEEEREMILNEKIQNSLLLEHHHLSDLVYKTYDEFENIKSDIDSDKSLLLIEGWNSEVIVTTFMQFFYSIFSNRNRTIRKFHNIINSIVILDEVQTIPHKYWVLLNESIKFFAEHFNTYFILVTATQPLIFDERSGEIKSLIGNKSQYYDVLDRVDMIPDMTPVNINDFKIILQEEIMEQHDKDFLIVMNTIGSSKEIYDFIKNEIEADLSDTKFYYLSTNIVPIERLRRIKEIKKRSKERKIIVSTQLVEAGVDIDVDVVYRDFGPLDSINQVSGRCNRNFSKDKGTVNVFILENDDAKKYYTYIYDGFIISQTEKVLKIYDKKTISESNFLYLSDAYFENIKTGQSADESEEIIDYVKRLNFNDLSKFELIKDEPYKVDIFVNLDDDAKDAWNKYQIIIHNKELRGFEKKREFSKIKKTFYSYVISVDEKKAERIFNHEFGIGYIDRQDLEDYYDLETGFKNTDNDVYII